MIPKLQKIISGGQTGVDRAALDAALERRFPCGGWCHTGRRAEDGPLHHRYPLLETPSPDYPLRTESNVRDADGTLILVEDMPSGGTALTVDVSIRLGKPLLVAYLITKPTTAGVIEWLVENDIRVLNVAGPRESQSPGIYAKAFRFIGRLLDDIRDARGKRRGGKPPPPQGRKPKSRKRGTQP